MRACVCVCTVYIIRHNSITCVTQKYLGYNILEQFYFVCRLFKMLLRKNRVSTVSSFATIRLIVINASIPEYCKFKKHYNNLSAILIQLVVCYNLYKNV